MKKQIETMTTTHPNFNSTQVPYALKVRQLNEKSWWVYRYEIGRRGELAPMPRVVFFGTNKAQTQAWLDKESQATRAFLLPEQ